MPSRPSSVSALVPILPGSFQPLVRHSTARRRLFCARGQQGRADQKSKTAVKAICRPDTAFYSLMAIPIFPRPKTAHSGPQTAKQGTKQPRPAPSGVSRGFIICSGRWIAPRSAPPFGHTRRSGDRTLQDVHPLVCVRQ